MGWQKRSSGLRYDSPCGFAALMNATAETPSILHCKVMTKIGSCRRCQARKEAGLPVTEEFRQMHDCCDNHEGSSKSMEAASGVQLIDDLARIYGLMCRSVTTDDDSTFRSWTKVDTPKCRLPRWCALAIKAFLADPNHRKKIFRKELVKAFNAQGDGPMLTCVMKNYVAAARSNRTKPIAVMRNAILNVSEHCWNNHAGCGDWCKAKKALAEGKQYAPPDYPDRQYFPKNDALKEKVRCT